MRTLIAVILLASTAHARADVMGLRFGMTAAAVRAARPCKAPVANPAKAALACKAAAFAGAKMDAELWLPKSGLARIALRARLGSHRRDAEAAADAIFQHLTTDYGPLDMTGVGEIAATAPLFDGTDRRFVQFKGKLKAASTFTAKHIADPSLRMIGTLVRDRDGYAIELTFAPRVDAPSGSP
jgi:hypothetical protein